MLFVELKNVETKFVVVAFVTSTSVAKSRVVVAFVANSDEAKSVVDVACVAIKFVLLRFVLVAFVMSAFPSVADEIVAEEATSAPSVVVPVTPSVPPIVVFPETESAAPSPFVKPRFVKNPFVDVARPKSASCPEIVLTVSAEIVVVASVDVPALVRDCVITWLVVVAFPTRRFVMLPNVATKFATKLFVDVAFVVTRFVEVAFIFRKLVIVASSIRPVVM